jgi:hypothetical protein
MEPISLSLPILEMDGEQYHIQRSLFSTCEVHSVQIIQRVRDSDLLGLKNHKNEESV